MTKSMQNQQQTFLHLLLRPVILFVALLSTPIHAIDYDVEVIIFEHVRDTTIGSSDTLLIPVIRDEEVLIPETSVPGAAVQPIGELRLTEELEKIRASSNHRLMYHGGWRQGPVDKETAPYMTIALGRSFNTLAEPVDDESIYIRGYNNPPADLPVDLTQSQSFKLYGGIKVWVGRFLHFDTLLSYTPEGADFSFAFESERRMRSRQLHYIDHPRVGIITKIFPVDETAPN